jgi:8-oxo-dGTP pyrophosphatase MutT (NUDIX family)
MTREKQWEFNVLAGAATVHDGLFLLLRRSGRESFLRNAWGIPAGTVHQDEDPREACQRELLEETGLAGNVVDLVSYSTFASKRRAIELSNLQLNFLVRVDDCEVKLNPASHSEFRWISLDAEDNDLVDSFTRSIMISARQYYKEAASRRVAHSRR